MSEKLASTIVMQELPTTTSGWMRTVGNRENVVAVDRSSLRCCVFLKLRFTNWSNRIGILLVFLCWLIDLNLKLRFDSNKFYGMVRHHLCACCLFKGFWKLRSTDLGIRLVFLMSLLDLTFRSQKYLFDIRCDIGKLRFMISVFSLVFLMSLINLTFWPNVGLLNMTFGWCSGDEGLGPRGDFSYITTVLWKLTSVMGLSEADLEVWRLVHCVPAAKHRYRIVIIATYAWCLAKA